jgi:hypothetical protein
MATHARTRRPIPAKPAVPVHGENARPPSGGASGPPAQEAIAARAYALFLARGGVHGDDWADWLQAEAELRAEGTAATGQAEP